MLRLPMPEADRMEYQFELTRRDGSVAIVCDPANPLKAPGPFGYKSVLEFPGYRPPEWLRRMRRWWSPPSIIWQNA